MHADYVDTLTPEASLKLVQDDQVGFRFSVMRTCFLMDGVFFIDILYLWATISCSGKTLHVNYLYSVWINFCFLKSRITEYVECSL